MPDQEELQELIANNYGKIADESAFFAQMIEAERLVVRLRVRPLYGVLLDNPPGA